MPRKRQLEGLPEGQRDLVTEGVLGDGFACPTQAADPALARWTGEQVKRHRPQVYAAAVKLLAAGLGTVDIAALLHVSPHTVARIRDGESSLAIEKERLARLAATVSRAALEGIAEDLADPVKRAKLNAVQLATIHGITTDKMQVLSGGPTSVVQSFSAQLDAGAWAEAMGSGAGNAGPKKAEGRGVVDVEAEVIGPEEGGSIDA